MDDQVCKPIGVYQVRGNSMAWLGMAPQPVILLQQQEVPGNQGCAINCILIAITILACHNYENNIIEKNDYFALLGCDIFYLIYFYLSYLYMFSSLLKCAPKYLLILFIGIYYFDIIYFCIGFSVELYVQGNQQLKRYCSNYYLYLF